MNYYIIKTIILIIVFSLAFSINMVFAQNSFNEKEKVQNIILEFESIEGLDEIFSDTTNMRLVCRNGICRFVPTATPPKWRRELSKGQKNDRPFAFMFGINSTYDDHVDFIEYKEPSAIDLYQNGKSDFSLRTDMSIWASQNLPLGLLSAEQYGICFEQYEENKGLNLLDQSLELSLQKHFGESSMLGLSDRFQRQSRKEEFYRKIKNAINLKFTQRYGIMGMMLFGRFILEKFDDKSIKDDYQFVDSKSYESGIRLRQIYGSSFIVAFGYCLSRHNYDDNLSPETLMAIGAESGQIRQDTQQTVTADMTYAINEHILIQCKGNFLSNNSDIDIYKYNQPEAKITLFFKPTQSVWVINHINHIQRRFRERPIGILINEPRIDRENNLSLYANWQFTKWLYMAVNYQFAKNRSNNPLAKFTHHTASVSLNIQY